MFKQFNASLLNESIKTSYCLQASKLYFMFLIYSMYYC